MVCMKIDGSKNIVKEVYYKNFRRDNTKVNLAT